MSNDIFVIANIAAAPDSSSAAGKADHERTAPARAAVGSERSHLRYESDQVIQPVIFSHGCRFDAVLRAVGTRIRIGNQAVGVTHCTKRRRIALVLFREETLRRIPLRELQITSAASSSGRSPASRTI